MKKTRVVNYRKKFLGIPYTVRVAIQQYDSRRKKWVDLELTDVQHVDMEQE